MIAVLHDYEQVRAYFANTLLLAREKVTAGATENVLTDEFLAQANRMMQNRKRPIGARFNGQGRLKISVFQTA